MKAINVTTGEYVKSVFLELQKESSQQPEEGLTGDQGAYTYQIRQTGIHFIRAHKVGYAPITKKINLTKEFSLS